MSLLEGPAHLTCHAMHAWNISSGCKRSVAERDWYYCPGMEYLHAAGILHGDLKPANVLLKSTSADRRGFLCKLCDFGMSRLMDATQATHVSTQTYGVSYVFLLSLFLALTSCPPPSRLTPLMGQVH